MSKDNWLAKYRTAAEIRTGGGIGNLNDGAVIRTHGVETRLLAWPGNGFQTESVHVLTLRAGEASAEYAYPGAEEAMLCVAGAGEVWMHGRWVRVEPGDIAYFPEGVRHRVRHTGGEDFVLVTQITPPQFDLYIEAGFYHVAQGVMNAEACFRAALNAPSGSLRAPLALAWRDSEADVRASSLGPAEVRRAGGLFNVFEGADFAALGIPARMVVWPGAGCRTAGFNFAYSPETVPDFIHTHPVSDECLILWAGTGRGFLGGTEWTDLDTLDVLLAPCGVVHGHWGTGGPSFWGGFVSPPQLDLLIKTPYYTGDAITPAESKRLDYDEPGDGPLLFQATP